MDLLLNIYVKYHLLEQLPTVLVPRILLWHKSNEGNIKDDRKLENMERNKLFSLNYFHEEFEFKECEYIINEIHEYASQGALWGEGVDEIEEEVNERAMQGDLDNPSPPSFQSPKHQITPKFKVFSVTIQQEKLSLEELRDKKLTSWSSVYESRLQLHRFIITTLEESLTWNSSTLLLKFFRAFFKFMNSLIARKFFASDYNHYL